MVINKVKKIKYATCHRANINIFVWLSNNAFYAWFFQGNHNNRAAKSQYSAKSINFVFKLWLPSAITTWKPGKLYFTTVVWLWYFYLKFNFHNNSIFIQHCVYMRIRYFSRLQLQLCVGYWPFIFNANNDKDCSIASHYYTQCRLKNWFHSVFIFHLPQDKIFLIVCLIPNKKFIITIFLFNSYWFFNNALFSQG